MKVLKKLLVLILTICMILPIIACGGEESCSHDNSVICKKCGEVVLGDSYYANMVKSTNSVLAKGKGMKTEASGTFNIKLDNETGAYMYEDVNGGYQKLIAPNVSGTMSADMTFGFKKDGELYAVGDMSADIKMKDATDKTLVNMVVSLEEFKLENNKLNYKFVSKTLFPTLSDAEKEINEDEDVEEDSINLTDSTDSYEILGQMIPKLLDVYSNTIVPYVNGIIDVNKKDINTAVATMLDSLCSVSKNGNNNVFTITKLGSAIKEIPTLLDTDINVVFDDIFGEGTYDKLPETAEKILDTKLEDIIKKLEEKGVKLNELVQVIDEVVKVVANDENASLKDLVGMDIVGVIDNLDKTKTIKQILINYDISEQQIEEFLTQLETYLDEYKGKSIYEIINELAQIQIGNEQKQMIKEFADAIANFVDEVFTIKLTADKNGNIVSYEYGIEVDGSSNATKVLMDLIKENYNFPSAGGSAISPEEKQFNTIMDIIPSVKCNMTYKTTLVNIA